MFPAAHILPLSGGARGDIAGEVETFFIVRHALPDRIECGHTFQDPRTITGGDGAQPVARAGVRMRRFVVADVRRVVMRAAKASTGPSGHAIALGKSRSPLLIRASAAIVMWQLRPDGGVRSVIFVE